MPSQDCVSSDQTAWEAITCAGAVKQLGPALTGAGIHIC